MTGFYTQQLAGLTGQDKQQLPKRLPWTVLARLFSIHFRLICSLRSISDDLRHGSDFCFQQVNRQIMQAMVNLYKEILFFREK